jgi:hypothetical protein
MVPTEVFSGSFERLVLEAERLAAGFLDDRVDEARDDERREGEVFVAIER